MTLLDLRNLRLEIGGLPILDDVSLAISSGEVVGLVGESGSGKSMTALSILNLLPRKARLQGSVRFHGTDLIGLPERDLVRLRGARIGMIFQEPMTALNPLMTIGDQVAETVQIHGRAGRRRAKEIASQTLDRVGLPDEKIAHSRYPHELSGGQRQRVGIAMAVAMGPDLLIADEPTTALDVTTQAQILDLLRDLVAERSMSLLLITHDLAVVADMADTVAVMEAGRIVEAGNTKDILNAPTQSYTRKLIAATAHTPRRAARKEGAVLLEVQNAVRVYSQQRRGLFAPRRVTRAVDGVSFDIRQGESVGLVGESGSGKSSLARAIMGLDALDRGTVRLGGESIAVAGQVEFSQLRRMQMVFQDPYGSFNPRHRVGRIVAEPLHLLGSAALAPSERDYRVADVLSAVGIAPEMAERYIHEFSGGQRQRIAIARALIVEPKLIVLDEAVSALDVSIRAQILDLLAEIASTHGVAYLFIAHDLNVVRAITDRVLVMKDGKIVEQGATAEVLEAPRHDYTRQLVAAAPQLAGVDVG